MNRVQNYPSIQYIVREIMLITDYLLRFPETWVKLYVFIQKIVIVKFLMNAISMDKVCKEKKEMWIEIMSCILP